MTHCGTLNYDASGSAVNDKRRRLSRGRARPVVAGAEKGGVGSFFTPQGRVSRSRRVADSSRTLTHTRTWSCQPCRRVASFWGARGTDGWTSWTVCPSTRRLVCPMPTAGRIILSGTLTILHVAFMILISSLQNLQCESESYILVAPRGTSTLAIGGMSG